jgi:hypothetical protein
MIRAHQITDAVPANCDPALWDQSMGLARQACARIFRDGGSPSDALRTFAITTTQPNSLDWSKAVSLIAETLSVTPMRRAA